MSATAFQRKRREEAAKAKASAPIAAPIDETRADLVESLKAHGVEKPKGGAKALKAKLDAITKVNL